MTPEEKEIQIALGTYLQTAWEERCKLVDAGDYATNTDGWYSLCDQGQQLFRAAVVDVYGCDMKLVYMSRHRCRLCNGVEFSR